MRQDNIDHLDDECPRNNLDAASEASASRQASTLIDEVISCLPLLAANDFLERSA